MIRIMKMKSLSKVVGTPEYNRWAGIKTRCYNKNNKAYYRYGGRGITMYHKWRYSFYNFINDIGKCPGPGFSLDRIDNDGNYEPGNVK